MKITARKSNIFTLSLMLGGVFMAPIASAQTIERELLGAAQAFDAGVIDVTSGGLDSGLWQGTSAATAAYLLKTAPYQSKNILVQQMLETVVLSAGVPPQSADAEQSEAYDTQRLASVMALSQTGGRGAALSEFIERNPKLTRAPSMRADLALAGGDIEGACSIADNLTEGRGEPNWARLRSFCHVERGETSAAELTAELLAGTGYQDPVFFGLMKNLTGASNARPSVSDLSDPLLSVMSAKASAGAGIGGAATALDSEASPSARLAAVFSAANDLRDDQITSVFSDLAYNQEDIIASSSFDLTSAKADSGPRGTAQLFQLANALGDPAGAAEAMSLILAKAEAAGVFSRYVALFEPSLSLIPAQTQSETNLALFTRAAIERGNNSALRGIYNALPEGEAKSRIALIADAMANGFTLGELGRDIEGRLEGQGSEKRRAIRDSFIAVAMGARLSGSAAVSLTGAGNGSGTAIQAGDLLALTAAAKVGSRAEVLLRSAAALDSATTLNNSSLAGLISALQEAGLGQFAGRIAAEDFLKAL